MKRIAITSTITVFAMFIASGYLHSRVLYDRDNNRYSNNYSAALPVSYMNSAKAEADALIKQLDRKLANEVEDLPVNKAELPAVTPSQAKPAKATETSKETSTETSTEASTTNENQNTLYEKSVSATELAAPSNNNANFSRGPEHILKENSRINQEITSNKWHEYPEVSNIGGKTLREAANPHEAGSGLTLTTSNTKNGEAAEGRAFTIANETETIESGIFDDIWTQGYDAVNLQYTNITNTLITYTYLLQTTSISDTDKK
jgi:hypothetical protein